MKAWLAFALALSSSAPALACDVYACNSWPVAFPEGVEVPVNAFLFEVLTEDALRLTDVASNANVPASIKWVGPDRVWSPDVELQVGQQLRVSYSSSCEPAVELTRSLVVTSAATLDQAASLQVIEQSADAPHGERHIRATVRYQPPTTSLNYLRVRIEVDGLPYGDSYSTGEQFQQLWARCDYPPNPDTTCGGYDSVTARKHDVKFIARAVGQDEEHVQTIDVDLRCEKKSEGCQLGVSGGGAWAWLALLLRRRRR